MKIAKSRLKEIINEEYKTLLSEQEIRTVGDLRAVLNKIKLAKKASGAAGVGKDFAKDAAMNIVSDFFPGAGTAKTVIDLVRSVWDPLGNQPDKKTGSPLDKLQIDPEVSKSVDDTVEEKFLDAISKELERINDNTPLDNLDMTRALQKYISREYDRRSVSTPEN